ncbi:MAG TPA: hypothetical protein VG297_21335 [Bryobacteraceae bacterium]|nr:hypothetical protein [Bryobacteraceae bacterium]
MSAASGNAYAQEDKNMNQSNSAGGFARRFVWGIALALLLGSTALVVRAFNPQPDPPGFYALVGMNPFETVRLHVVNIGGTNGAPPDPCRVNMGFVNLAGQTVKSVATTLGPGQGASIDVTFNEVAQPGLFASNRVAVRPVFYTVPPDPCFAASSAEVFETATGQSRIYAIPSLQYPTPAAVATNATPQ